MDTRRKILILTAAERLPSPLTVVTGYFDVLRAGHVRMLGQVWNRTSGGKLLVAVVTYPEECLDGLARSELVAALRMVDYVVTANHDELDAFLERLQPAALVRLEAADLSLRRQLIEDVQRRPHS